MNENMHPVTDRARAAREYAELMELVGTARAAVDDVYAQITQFEARRSVLGASGSFASAANARSCVRAACSQLAAVAIFVEAMGA